MSDQHPEDYCHRCGGPNISWFTPGAAWDPVMRSDGEWKWGEIICPQCFVALAGGGTWHLIPARDDGEAWTSADERERIKADAATEALAAVGANARAVEELEAAEARLADLRARVEARAAKWSRLSAEAMDAEVREWLGAAAHSLRALLDDPAPDPVTADEVALVIRDAGISGAAGDYIGPFDRSRADAILDRFHVTRRADA